MRPSPDVVGRPQLAWLLSLPVVARGDVFRAAESGGRAGGSSAPLRILLVEDDGVIAEMYRTQLRLDGYVVDVAPDAGAALAALESAPPHLVLLDLRLPGRDGFGVLEELRSRWEVPVVILSNYGEPDLVARGRALGAVDYVVKSRITPPDLSQLIPRWLDAWSDEHRS